MTLKDVLTHTDAKQFIVIMYGNEKLCYGINKNLINVLSEATLGTEVFFFTPDGTTLNVRLKQPTKFHIE